MNYETYEVRVYDNGDKFWYQNGKLHRVDGPAAEYANGDKSWWQNDKLHRVDGPAAEDANGDKRWYFEGKSYLEKEFLKLTTTTCQGKMVEVDGVKYKLEKI